MGILNLYNGAQPHMSQSSFTFLDSPATTNAVTYSIKIGGNGFQTIYINREGRNSDNATDTTIASSTLTLMEISA